MNNFNDIAELLNRRMQEVKKFTSGVLSSSGDGCLDYGFEYTPTGRHLFVSLEPLEYSEGLGTENRNVSKIITPEEYFSEKDREGLEYGSMTLGVGNPFFEEGKILSFSTDGEKITDYCPLFQPECGEHPLYKVKLLTSKNPMEAANLAFDAFIA